MHQGRRDIYEFLLEKISIKKKESQNLHSLLFRAIRMRNYPLVVKLHNLGISLDKLDEKGNNVFHILFSIFVNNYEQCAQIGNLLIEKEVPGYNSFNQDGWAPIHIAAKYSSYICFEWIDHINKITYLKILTYH